MKIPKVYITRLHSRCVRDATVPKNHRENGKPFTKPCLLWTGAKDQKGYGVMRLRPRNAASEGDMGIPSGLVRVHRLAYWIAHGPFPVAMQIDHGCRHKSCVEPEHLYLAGPVEHSRLSNLDGRRDVAERLRVLNSPRR